MAEYTTAYLFIDDTDYVSSAWLCRMTSRDERRR